MGCNSGGGDSLFRRADGCLQRGGYSGEEGGKTEEIKPGLICCGCGCSNSFRGQGLAVASEFHEKVQQHLTNLGKV